MEFTKPMNVLVVAAHPDDEVLGCGGAIAKHRRNGDNVEVLIVVSTQSARGESVSMLNSIKLSSTMLDVEYSALDYTDQGLGNACIAPIADSINGRLNQIQADIAYTHWSKDLNADHRIVSEATLVAARPHACDKLVEIRQYYTFSSTEWSPEPFNPNLFISLGERDIQTKLSTFRTAYPSEIEPYPHPRSEQAIRNAASYFGSMCGTYNAEPFVQVRAIA